MSRQGRTEGRQRPVSRSLEGYARGVIGGLLFSLPLLYTMEVWWAGFLARPPRLLAYFVVGFLLLFAYNRYSGLRKDASWLEVGFEATEEMGLGLLIAGLVLWLVGQIDAGMPGSEVMGKVVVEGVTVAIGVSVGSAQLGGQGKGGGGDQGMEGDEKDTLSLSGQLALAACGAILLAGNLAPTEEILMIAVEAPAWRLVGLALLSLAMTAVVFFYSDFRGSHRMGERLPAVVLSRTVTGYAVALAVSAFVLWFFDRFANVSPAAAAAQVVVLGVAGSLGAAVGRLLLQPS
jgi:putative integral membrane protein (TIGR02587 family)